MHTPATPEAVVQALTRAMAEARLARIPRNPQRRAIVLAVVCLPLQRRYAYSESELNEILKAELGRFNASVDHVTCRRYLVDLGFLKRDRAGSRYFLNFPKLEATLSQQTMDSAANLVEAAIAITRRRRESDPEIRRTRPRR